MEEYLHEGVWFQPLYERGVWGNEVSPQRNTAERGFEPLISKVTTSRLNQLSHSTNGRTLPPLSPYIFFWEMKRTQLFPRSDMSTLRERGVGTECLHRAPPPHKKVMKSP